MQRNDTTITNMPWPKWVPALLFWTPDTHQNHNMIYNVGPSLTFDMECDTSHHLVDHKNVGLSCRDDYTIRLYSIPFNSQDSLPKLVLWCLILECKLLSNLILTGFRFFFFTKLTFFVFVMPSDLERFYLFLWVPLFNLFFGNNSFSDWWN